MEAYPLPDQQSETIAQKLVLEFISRFGTPLEIHSDQGKNFESSLFAEICKLFEIKKDSNYIL
jgi:transposase InsO family protein